MARAASRTIRNGVTPAKPSGTGWVAIVLAPWSQGTSGGRPGRASADGPARRAFCQKRGGPYWKNFTSIGERGVVGVVAPFPDGGRWGGARKGAEVVDEVRLVVVAARQGDHRPVGRLSSVDELQHFLKALDPAVQLGGQPDFV